MTPVHQSIIDLDPEFDIYTMERRCSPTLEKPLPLRNKLLIVAWVLLFLATLALLVGYEIS